MKKENCIIFSTDEMGIGNLVLQPFSFLGTNPLRKYGYSHIGCPAVL